MKSLRFVVLGAVVALPLRGGKSVPYPFVLPTATPAP